MFDGTIIRCARSIQIRGEAQSDGMKNFAARIKSAVGIFYIYLMHIICYLPFQIFWACIKCYGSSIAPEKTFSFLTDSDLS